MANPLPDFHGLCQFNLPILDTPGLCYSQALANSLAFARSFHRYYLS